MKGLRAVRFDGSDARVFERAAAEHEVLVSGASSFANNQPSQLTGKLRQAFVNGFLGTSSLGHSTFAAIGEVSGAELAVARDALEQNLFERLNAPRDVAARIAADEIAFVLDLVKNLPINAVLSVRRRMHDNGEISEEFRQIRANHAAGQHAQIWTIEDDDA